MGAVGADARGVGQVGGHPHVLGPGPPGAGEEQAALVRRHEVEHREERLVLRPAPPVRERPGQIPHLGGIERRVVVSLIVIRTEVPDLPQIFGESAQEGGSSPLGPHVLGRAAALGRHAGQDREPRGRAYRGAGEGVVVPHPLPGEAVQGGRTRQRVPIGAEERLLSSLTSHRMCGGFGPPAAARAGRPAARSPHVPAASTFLRDTASIPISPFG